jgi:hypothetical protein
MIYIRRLSDLRDYNRSTSGHYWCGLISNLDFQHSKEMPLVVNDQGSGLYRMVFFARHAFPNRIWSDVAKGPNRSLDLFE